MITFKDYLKKTLISEVSINHQHNIEKLLKVVNELIKKYGKTLTCSSGYRSRQRQLDIYRAKGYSDDKIPMGSGHLKGLAIDLYDPDGAFDDWCSKNQDLLEQYGLWQEQPTVTTNWCHLDLLDRPKRDRPNCLKRQFNP